MNLFKYTVTMNMLDSPIALIGVLLLALFLVVVILKMYFGMRRGTLRQAFRTGTTATAALISFIIATNLSNKIVGSTDVHTIEDLVSSVGNIFPALGDLLRKLLLSIDPTVFESIYLIPATIIIMPLVATGLFIVINIIFKIIRGIIVKILRFKKAKTIQQRLGGALLAGIEAIICFIMISLPLCGIVSLVDRAYEKAADAPFADENTELERIHDNYLSPFTDNPAFVFINSVGAESISDSIATVKIDDKQVNIRDEVVDISSIVMSESTVLKESYIGDLDNDAKDAIENIIDGVCDSPYMTRVASGALRSARVVFDSGIIEIQDTEDFSKIVDGFICYLETITDETLYEDLTTMKDLLFTISDSGAIAALEQEEADLFTVLQNQRKKGDDTISKVVDILQSNERTKGLVKTITEVLIASISTEIKLEDGTTVEVTYDDLKDGMNQVLSVKPENFETREEYMENLSTALDNTLTEHGIKLEYEIVDSIAEYIDENYVGNDEFTDEEFNDVLLHYYDAYLEYLETGEVPDDLPEDLPEDIVPDQDDKENQENDSNENQNESNNQTDYPDVSIPDEKDPVIPDENYDVYVVVEALIIQYPDGIPAEVFATLPADVIEVLIEFGYGPGK